MGIGVGLSASPLYFIGSLIPGSGTDLVVSSISSGQKYENKVQMLCASRQDHLASTRSDLA